MGGDVGEGEYTCSLGSAPGRLIQCKTITDSPKINITVGGFPLLHHNNCPQISYDNYADCVIITLKL